jgi:hypothetical protein
MSNSREACGPWFLFPALRVNSMLRTIPAVASAILVTVAVGARQRPMAEPVGQPAAAGVGIQAAGRAPAEVSTPVADEAAGAPKNPVEPVYSVVSPLGDPTVKVVAMAPRLDTLAGKTVGMVWNQAFNADITLPAIAEALKEKYPDIKIIPYTEMDAAMQAAGPDPEDPKAEMVALQAVLKAKGCDALISGNGG